MRRCAWVGWQQGGAFTPLATATPPRAMAAAATVGWPQPRRTATTRSRPIEKVVLGDAFASFSDHCESLSRHRPGASCLKLQA